MTSLLLLLTACITDVEALFDRDGDGYGSIEGDCETCSDCDDDNPNVHIDAAELCDDGLDNDCDGQTDDVGVGSDTFYVDGDSDGFGSGAAVQSCTRPAGHAAVDGDCDDNAADVNPDADERCNERDDDCDGSVDDGIIPPTWYADADNDGYGDASSTADACTAPSGHVGDDTDCDDADAAIHPGASDAWYDGVDSDCAGDSDFDADGDGFDSDAYSGTDCDDSDGLISPDASEICSNGIDEDCDGLAVGCGLLGSIASSDADFEASVSFGPRNLLSVGDVSGDGVDDLGVHGSATGMIFYGPPGTADVTVSTAISDFSMHHDLTGDGVPDLVVASGEVAMFSGGSLPASLDDSAAQATARIARTSPGVATAPSLLAFGEPATGNSFVQLWQGPLSGELAGPGDQSAFSAVEWGHDLAWVGGAAGAGEAFLVSSTAGEVALLSTPLQPSITDHPVFTSMVEPGRAFPNRPGDLTGDGVDDVVLGDRNDPSARVFLVPGPVDHTTPISMASYSGPRIAPHRSDTSEFPSSIALVDLNGDGFDDLAIGDTTSHVSSAEGGFVDVFYGPLDHITNTTTTADADLTIAGPGGSFGGIGSALESGDLNGDGIEDLVIADAMGGKVYVFYGSGM